MTAMSYISRPRILCVTDFYLPGFRGGGPIRTISNLREALRGQAEISVFTRNRDLGRKNIYPHIKPNIWHDLKDGPIFYADEKVFGPIGLDRVLSAGKFDILYLNSFFSTRGSVGPLLYRHMLRRGSLDLPVILAPRGEFSPAALAMKGFKKRLFIKATRIMGMYRDVHWQASTADEEKCIRNLFPEAAKRIHTAVDAVSSDKIITDRPLTQSSGRLRVAFISRINPIKNLDGLLHIFQGLNIPTELKIYGPVEDKIYWARCKKIMGELPAHIVASFHGPLEPESVSPTFARHDLFVFPSHGENFGHVIFEALCAGTPVITSDRTPWKSSSSGALTVMALGDLQNWQSAIEKIANMSEDERAQLRQNALACAKNFIQRNGGGQQSLDMFKAVIACSSM
ncbi:glycosyltransferase family 4 protein [Falsigemmobacter faecalis]|uniref:Glycosyltransferase n=1 Tax=Falsigemmobacter faecalis TaxID=2488730 RepID=A0A3P3CZH2_9RHOB|nr:glycosyltransferase [Falsigemmobacter faecalis]RRH67615.1 glycosyltransferase [Falsigemmobacter faecalis]